MARIGVYDRYWPTGGGGEKFAAGIAAALADEYRVELLAHEPVDRDWLGERLALDLSAVEVRLVPEPAGAVSRASGDYDLFVNASYLSGDPNRARKGLYVVHFPGPLPTGAARARTWLAGRGAEALGGGAGAARVAWGEGYYLPEESRLHTLRWTAGDASFTVSREHGDGDGDDNGGAAAGGGPVPVVVHLGRFVPAEVGPVEVVAEADGVTLGKAVVTAPSSRRDRRRTVPLRFTLDVAPGAPVTVWLRCRSWVPADHGIGTDRRRLGVPVVGLHAGAGARSAVAAVVPQLVGPGAGLDFLDSYDRIVSNSAYTQRWTQRLWGRPSGVLYPPVTPVEPAHKMPIILSVGRFFVPGTGHNKKQLEMVRAFRRLVESGAAPGWSYHLVGGCAPEHRPYLDEVVEAARGLPVEVHADASGADLAALYGRASVFWHAAGLGEDPELFPDRYEHFGITTVEAMSAGAVPVVVDAAGQAEVVERGRSGLRFRDVDGLVAATTRLVEDPALLATLAEGARRRAAHFTWEPFVARTRAEVADLLA
ncbi:MAG TPA: glycosyltransferase family 4 protein [Acidimicrobiales bacterium]|nr:glycosyltransferase family 4 protein [Acidimicrobiales bacterium]